MTQARGLETSIPPTLTPSSRISLTRRQLSSDPLTAAGTETAHRIPACSFWIRWIAFAQFRRPSAGRLQGRQPVSLSRRPRSRFRVRPPAGSSGYVNHRIPTRREPKMSASAPAVNSVTLVGNLTADPVLKQLDEDRKVCQLRLAVNDVKDQPMFIDVATFGAQADACAKYLTKGRAVAVTGRLVYREWDDNGTRRSRHHIVGRVQFGGRTDNGDQPTNDDQPQEDAA